MNHKSFEEQYKTFIKLHKDITEFAKERANQAFIAHYDDDDDGIVGVKFYDNAINFKFAHYSNPNDLRSLTFTYDQLSKSDEEWNKYLAEIKQRKKSHEKAIAVDEAKSKLLQAKADFDKASKKLEELL